MKGDLIKLAEQGEFDVIVHGCNCHNTMSAGIAKTIKLKYPEVYEADLQTISGDYNKLGTITFAKVNTYNELTKVNTYNELTKVNTYNELTKVNTSIDNHAFYIVNAYTQYYYGRKRFGKKLESSNIQSEPNVHCDYEAIRRCFALIKQQFGHLKIGYPLIGCGLAKGEWRIVKEIINEELKDCDHEPVYYVK